MPFFVHFRCSQLFPLSVLIILHSFRFDLHFFYLKWTTGDIFTYSTCLAISFFKLHLLQKSWMTSLSLDLGLDLSHDWWSSQRWSLKCLNETSKNLSKFVLTHIFLNAFWRKRNEDFLSIVAWFSWKDSSSNYKLNHTENE